jgi:hypothetical protein
MNEPFYNKLVQKIGLEATMWAKINIVGIHLTPLTPCGTMKIVDEIVSCNGDRFSGHVSHRSGML